jgi:hypothetical protein
MGTTLSASKAMCVALISILNAELAIAQDQKPSNTMGAINNNKGIITQGQSGGNNTVVNAPPIASIDQKAIDRIRQEVSAGATFSITKTIMDSDSNILAERLFAELIKLGYKPERQAIDSAFGRPYFRGLQILQAENKYVFVIGDPHTYP